MTYNQKIWLGVLLLCTLFWVVVIGGACSLYNRLDRLNTNPQESEFASHYGQATGTHHSAQTQMAPRNG